MPRLRPVIALSFLVLPLAASLILAAAHRQGVRRQQRHLRELRLVQNNGHLEHAATRVVQPSTTRHRGQDNPPIP